MDKRPPFPLVKICGITSKNIAEASDNADFVGLVIGSPLSKRNLDIDTAYEIASVLECSKPVAVTVSSELVKKYLSGNFDLPFLQVHGNARAAFLQYLAELADEQFGLSLTDEMHWRLSKWEFQKFIDSIFPITKSVAVSLQIDELLGRRIQDEKLKLLLNFAKYSNHSFLLYLTIDSLDRAGYGGTGKTWKWTRLPNLFETLLVAGGINVKNANNALLQTGADGIDVSSGVEINGRKDSVLITELIMEVKSYGNDKDIEECA